MKEKLVREGALTAPAGYWDLPEYYILTNYNGCGPMGGTLMIYVSYIIPDNLLGLDISDCCRIHDYCYDVKMEKKAADNLFLDNMSAKIDRAGGWLKGPRHVLAFHYYLAVKAGAGLVGAYD